MKRLTIDVIRMIALWTVLAVGQGLGGLLFFRHAASFPGDGPLDAGQALLLVSLIDATILTLLASAMRIRGWRLGLILACASFGIQTFQSVIETIIFNGDVRMPATLLAAVTAAAFVRDL